MTTLLDLSRSPNLGEKVALYHIDLSMFNEADLYLFEGNEGSTTVSYDGQEYFPWPMTASGFQFTIDGSLPRPTITVANPSGLFTPLVENNDDLKGAIVTRTVTWSKFLDGGADPDPNMHYAPDVFIINRKTSHVMDVSITFELVAAIDLENVMLPGRLVIRESCDLEQRLWDPVGAAFVYTNVTCPYVGATSYDRNGDVVVGGANEVFSKKLDTCCVPRFGAGPYPFGGFPGVSRYRRR